MSYKHLVLAFLSVVLLTAAPIQVQSQEAPTQDSTVTITLTDGTVIRGTITQETDSTLTVVTPGGVEMTLPRSSVVSVEAFRGSIVEGRLRRSDPNYSRLIFSPTGRPLRQGEGYFSDFYIFLPGVAYGITDNFSIWGGFSFFPGVSFDRQLFYVAPRFGAQFSDNTAISVGFLYATMKDAGVGAGTLFAVGTFGEVDRSITVGLGWPYVDTGVGFEIADYPILVLGANFRLSNSMSFVTENWIVTGAGVDAADQPLSASLRIFGDNIAVDAGFIFTGNSLDNGFPIPLVSFVYNFGK